MVVRLPCLEAERIQSRHRIRSHLTFGLTEPAACRRLVVECEFARDYRNVQFSLEWRVAGYYGLRANGPATPSC